MNILKRHIKNDIFCWKNKWYIFSNLLKRKLLKQNHDDFYAKHFDYNKIFDLIKKKYFWTDINKNVKQYVEFCMTCRKIKTVKHRFYEFLNFLFMSENSRKNWIMNFITDLFFSSHRKIINDSILIIMNRYIKFAKYISTKKIWTAENLADAIINIVFIQFEKFIFIVIDKNFFFTFNFWSVFCYHMWTRLRYSIVYHFQTDEQTEKQNQIFEIIWNVMLTINKTIESNDSVRRSLFIIIIFILLQINFRLNWYLTILLI